MIFKNKILPTSESETVEFKTSFNEDVIETLVAFSNTKGGVVYIGIADNGEIKGTQLGKETTAQWINEVKNKTAPQIIPDINILSEYIMPTICLVCPKYLVCICNPCNIRGTPIRFQVQH